MSRWRASIIILWQEGLKSNEFARTTTDFQPLVHEKGR